MTIKLTPAQLSVVKRMQPNRAIIGTRSMGHWISGGDGTAVSIATIESLKTKGIIDGTPYVLTTIGKQIKTEI